jgi:hypothetical protein
MATWLLLLCCLVASWLAGAAAGAGRGGGGGGDGGSQVYIVYLGAVPPSTSTDLIQESHLCLVGTVLKRSVGASVLTAQYS